MKDENKIDWAAWLSLSSVAIWEACALSLDIDPAAMNKRHDDYRSGPGGHRMYGEGRNQTQRLTIDEYQWRMRLISSNIRDRRHFSQLSRQPANEAYYQVRLSEVAAYLAVIGRKPIAHELLKIASAPIDIAQDPTPKPLVDRSPWRPAAKIIANEIRKQHKTWTKGRVAAEVASQLKSQNVLGRGGKPVTAESVLRHAINDSESGIQAMPIGK